MEVGKQEIGELLTLKEARIYIQERLKISRYTFYMYIRPHLPLTILPGGLRRVRKGDLEAAISEWVERGRKNIPACCPGKSRFR